MYTKYLRMYLSACVRCTLQGQSGRRISTSVLALTDILVISATVPAPGLLQLANSVFALEPQIPSKYITADLGAAYCKASLGPVNKSIC